MFLKVVTLLWIAAKLEHTNILLYAFKRCLICMKIIDLQYIILAYKFLRFIFFPL